MIPMSGSIDTGRPCTDFRACAGRIGGEGLASAIEIPNSGTAKTPIGEPGDPHTGPMSSPSETNAIPRRELCDPRQETASTLGKLTIIREITMYSRYIFATMASPLRSSGLPLA
jgi:hypothetical protein